MNKYLIARKKGEMANEVFHLQKDTSNTFETSTIPWITRRIKKIKTKEDIIKYHKEKIEKLLKSKYFVVEETTKISINTLLEICQNKIDNTNEGDINAMARIVYKKISSPIWISVFAMKINLLEWMLIFILVVVLVNLI